MRSSGHWQGRRGWPGSLVACQTTRLPGYWAVKQLIRSAAPDASLTMQWVRQARLCCHGPDAVLRLRKSKCTAVTAWGAELRLQQTLLAWLTVPQSMVCCNWQPALTALTVTVY